VLPAGHPAKRCARAWPHAILIAVFVGLWRDSLSQIIADWNLHAGSAVGRRPPQD
jgi:hypothetical protein